MAALTPSERAFMDKLSKLTNENMADEQFGVSELAGLLGMSRSNLLRKIRKLTALSASQYIRQERLIKAMLLLREESLNVSEVAYAVGFRSTSYFVKCFHDYYGFPPGEAVLMTEAAEKGDVQAFPLKKRSLLFIAGMSLLVIVLFVLLFFKPFFNKESNNEKSIAVLPFKNESSDPSNVYFINGLMESVLNNLQQIQDLRVISRTSVEKYRDNPQLIPEIAEALDVKYFVEGSGQKVGTRILFNVQLIDASKDKHIWAKQYDRELSDIFSMQMDIAKSIADEVKAIITPEEEARIEKAPTDNIVAYDYFLQGIELMYRGKPGDLDSAIHYYELALAEDPDFARANALIAVSYYFMDAYQSEKQYSGLINRYADKALLLDPELAQSLIAKAIYYLNTGENIQALPYLEKALDYNPNSILVINILSDFYATQIPNTSKYLEYALKGLRISLPEEDSISVSFSLLHVSNAFIQSGFIDEAEKYINKSLQFFPENIWSQYVKVFILYAKNNDLEKARDRLIGIYEKDTSRWDVLQEVAKLHYFLHDYESAYYYYKRFIRIKEDQGLDVYSFEDAKIAYVLSELGRHEEARKYIEQFRITVENDHSVYRHLNFAAYYSLIGNQQDAIRELGLFSEESNFNIWMPLFLKIDPIMEKIRSDPEYINIYKKIESNFWQRHDKIRITLEKQGLI